MRAIDSRIRRLQQRLCPDEDYEQRIWVPVIYGRELALDTDRCVDILRECGFLPKTRFLVLSLTGIPHGLNAQELEQYLRKNGARICGTDRDQQQKVPSAASRLANPALSAQTQIGADWGR